MRFVWMPGTLRPRELCRSACMHCGGSSSGSLPTTPAGAPHLVRRVLWVRLRPVRQLGQWDVEGLRQGRAGEAVAAEWPSLTTRLWKLCRGLADRQQSAAVLPGAARATFTPAPPPQGRHACKRAAALAPP